MPPLPTLRTFITALKTGETRTTWALTELVAQSRGAQSLPLRALLRKRGALAAPLQPAFRQALRDVGLADTEIQQCIDRWPEGQKEKVRKALVAAVSDDRRVRFTWGLTAAEACETTVDTPSKGAVTITSLSPRSSLRVYDGQQVIVEPVNVAAVRPARKKR